MLLLCYCVIGPILRPVAGIDHVLCCGIVKEFFAGTGSWCNFKDMARPEIYTIETANLLCTQIATTSKSLRTICNDEKMPCVATVLKWLNEDKNGFLAQYTRAKEEQADYLIEEMIDIADDGSNDLMTITKGDTSYEQENKEVTNRSKLRVETRKWIASKLKPKKYGDKIDVTSAGEKVQSEPQLTDGQFNKLLKHINANSNPG